MHSTIEMPLAPELRSEVEFELCSSRTGLPALRLGGRTLHSTYDPLRDARSQVDRILKERELSGAPGIAILGAGLGYLTRRLREASPVPVVVWEPFSGLRESIGDVAVVDGDAAALSPLEFEAALARDISGRAPFHFVVHPGYEELTHFEQRYALAAQRRRIGRGAELAPDEAIASRRALDTLRRFPHLRTLPELRQHLSGRTAIVASGGPSLDALLPLLRERRGGVLLAAPQALAKLLAWDVPIDFVVNPDPADLLSPLLRDGESPFGALIADAASHPAVLDRCPDRTFLFQLRSPQIQQLAWQVAGLPIVDEPLITVTDTAFWVARTLGARRVLLAGADFASETRDYGGPFRARSVTGSRCTTNPVYFHGARCIAHALSQEPTLEVRRVGEGVRIPGAEPIGIDALPDWLAGDDGVAAAELPARSGARPLAAAAYALADRPPPNTGRVSPYPAREPWLDLAPLQPAELRAAWRELRQELRAGTRAPWGRGRRSRGVSGEA